MRYRLEIYLAAIWFSLAGNMTRETHIFEFGEFTLDTREKSLVCAGKPLAVTPKAFELLVALIENHGHLVEKDELMRQVWADCFVEEGNLAYTIRLLRKILDDAAQNPRFIETVPRRGYRFVAEVRSVEQDAARQDVGTMRRRDDEKNNNLSDRPLSRRSSVASAPRPFVLYLLPAAILLIAVVAFGGWYVRSNRAAAIDAPVLNAPFSSEKLSTDGKVYHAVVSPDGKNVVYTNGFKAKQSVWLRQLETANNVEIIPPSDVFYYGLAFSPDGNFVYFARRTKLVEGQADIFRVSIFGGVPQKIVSEAQGWISVAPDGGRISFVRCYYREDEICSLWIADALDGKNERKLLARPFRIGDHEFSPDGKTIAFAAGQSNSGANEFGLFEIDLESGAERVLTAEKFFNVRGLAWLPNQRGWLVTASRFPDKTFRIWQIAAATGAAAPLTKDWETYANLSLNSDADVLISTEVKEEFHLQLFSAEDAAPRVVAKAMTVAFTPNGKIIFSSAMTGNSEIWSIQKDGGEQRQLTNNAADDLAAAVSPDNRSIFFASNRTGALHVWRMNADGSSQTQITRDEGGFPLFVSPDGKWLYYNSARRKTLRRVATEGGAEQEILDRANPHYAVSPDGLSVAYPEEKDSETILKIISLADVSIIKTFKTAAGKNRVNHLAWSPDGKSLAYITADTEFENNRLWQQPLGGEPARQIADLGDEEIHAVSALALAPDGKHFAVAQGGWRHDAVLLRGLK